ncbi:MAG TPA: 3-oxoacyl-ACP reductase FabG [Aeromonadales bacterium]|nr:3-oxoacyl-ACP reductase FabG [Aeromonadales bacterium]
MNIEQNLALVTGASRGIGKAIALELASSGYKVIGTATTEQGAENISNYLQENGYDGKGMVLNVADDDSINLLMDTIKEQFNESIAVLVNNAGITRDNLLMRMKTDEWDAIISTNLSSVFKMSKKVLRPMMKKKWGRIVTIGSVVGSTGNPGQANYAAAKAGLIGFSKSLASEIGSRGITVNVVAPGFIDTDMTKSLDENQRSALISKIPGARLGTPEDIAKAVSFLCSEGAGYITGETIHVNGGMFMA